MDSFSNQSFHQEPVLNCLNCGFPMETARKSTFNSNVQPWNMLEASKKPQWNQGDCDEPASSSEDEPDFIESVSSERTFRTFETNLANNRWLKGKAKDILKPMNRPPPCFSRDFTHRKPVRKAKKHQKTPEKPIKVVQIDLNKNAVKPKPVSSHRIGKNVPVNTINLVEQLKKSKLGFNLNTDEVMPPQPIPYKLFH